MSLFKTTLSAKKPKPATTAPPNKARFPKTLHAVHKETIEGMSKGDLSLDEIDATLNETLEQLANLHDDDVQQYLIKKNTLEQQLADLRNEKANILDKASQLDYFSKTNELLCQYYKKQPLVAGPTKEKIVNFFNIKCEAPNDDNEQPAEECSKNKKTLLKRYYNILDKKNALDDKPTTTKTNCCEDCEEELIKSEDGYILCPMCGAVANTIYSYDKQVYNDPPPDNSYFAYQKISHLNELLSQIQGIETTEIDKSVYQRIMGEIRKDRRTDLKKLTASNLKQYLKKLGLHKYYEHIPHILYKLTSIAPMRISPPIIAKIRHMFGEIQEPFERLRKSGMKIDRTNIISYKYILYKFMELLGLEEFKQKFTLLKNRENLIEHDIIWKEIVKSLGWKYIPTI